MRLALRAVFALITVALSLLVVGAAGAAPGGGGGNKTMCEIALVDFGTVDGTSVGNGSTCLAELPDGVGPDRTTKIDGQCVIQINANGRVLSKC